MVPECISLAAEIRAAVLDEFGVDAPVELSRAPRAVDADQCSAVAFRVSRLVRLPPPLVAARLGQSLRDLRHFQDAQVLGAYLNFSLRPDWLAAELVRRSESPTLGISPADAPESVVVDFSSPNVAKRMHVGHLRSTIIGDALVRTLRRLGHSVTSDNHIGDWGTQFGMLLWAWKSHRDDARYAEAPIDELERLYRLAVKAGQESAEVAAACRRELALLQRGDPQNLEIWREFVSVSLNEAAQIYRRLGVRFDLCLGESAYRDELGPLVEDLLSEGVAVSDGPSVVVRFAPESELAASPLLVQKTDGAWLYATTDIATIDRRVSDLRADRIIYVVDVRQSLHFKQIFAVARMRGLRVQCDHVGFGMMLGCDGRPFRTRDGGTLTLSALLDEATARALAEVQSRCPDLSPECHARVASAVGIAAVKFADLSHNLATDYRFDWDAMLSFDGNSGPYLQYTLVRARSLLDAVGAPGTATPPSLSIPEERALATRLLEFPETLSRVASMCRPHLLCEYLIDLARAFNAFYAVCDVKRAEASTRAGRTVLVQLTERTLAAGLDCLNLPVPDVM